MFTHTILYCTVLYCTDFTPGHTNSEGHCAGQAGISQYLQTNSSCQRCTGAGGPVTGRLTCRHSSEVFMAQMQSTGDQMEDGCDYLFKIILIGDSSVGKTCIIHSFRSGIFSDGQHNTIGVDFTLHTMDIDGKRVKMQIWDTAGQERFRTVTQSYYRCADGAVIAYDLTRRPTFDSLPHWIQGVEQYGAANVVFVLIGNKCDLEAQRQVLFEEACTLAEQRGVLAALETSAKNHHNIEEAFELMARELIVRRRGGSHQDDQSDSPSVFLLSDSHPIEEEEQPKKSCDC